jgi:D-tyrosyl-tRNA(Tyr) deacylase
VTNAEVRVAGQVVGSIGPGVLTFLGVGAGDTPELAERLVSKILKLRIFADEQGRMNKSLLDVSGGHLLVSQFTLFGDLSKGNRPSFMGAGDPSIAERIYEHAVAFSRSQGVETAAGRFQADMKVALVNDGPATFILEMTEGQ